MPYWVHYLTHLSRHLHRANRLLLRHWIFQIQHQTATLFGRFADQSHFTGHEPNASIEVRSEATPIVSWRRCSLESTCDDLAATLDASEAGERSDVGRLASPRFLQERETSVNSWGIYHSNRKFWCILLSLLYKHCAYFSVGKEKSVWNKEVFVKFFERKADQACGGECAAQTRLSEAQSVIHRRESKMQSAGRALHQSGIQLHSKGWNFTKQVSQLISPRRKRVGYVMDWQWETKLVKKIVQKVTPKKLRRICCTEAERARQ